jgi:hypothetical protein
MPYATVIDASHVIYPLTFHMGIEILHIDIVHGEDFAVQMHNELLLK